MSLARYLEGPRFHRERAFDWEEAERRRRRQRWVEGGRPAAFSLAAVAGYFAHYRGQDLVLADMDPVGAWDDASGQGHALSQATASKKPAYRTGVQNGLPVVRFDATDDYLGFGARILSPRSGSFTVFAVGKTSGTAAAAIAAQDEGTPVLQLLLNNTAGKARVFLRDAGGQAAIAQSVTDLRGAFHLVTYAWDLGSKTVTLRVDGAQEATQANASITPATLPDGIWGIGAQFNGAGTATGFYLADDLAELVVYNEVVTGGDLTGVEGVLRATWGTP